ncbi:hypothetical protein TYRP_012629, partial [Tyrophagus putrescentiae]
GLGQSVRFAHLAKVARIFGSSNFFFITFLLNFSSRHLSVLLRRLRHQVHLVRQSAGPPDLLLPEAVLFGGGGGRCCGCRGCCSANFFLFLAVSPSPSTLPLSPSPNGATYVSAETLAAHVCSVDLTAQMAEQATSTTNGSTKPTTKSSTGGGTNPTPSTASLQTYKCTICGYKGHTMRGMRTHVRVHSEQLAATGAYEEEFIVANTDLPEPSLGRGRGAHHHHHNHHNNQNQNQNLNSSIGRGGRRRSSAAASAAAPVDAAAEMAASNFAEQHLGRKKSSSTSLPPPLQLLPPPLIFRIRQV